LRSFTTTLLAVQLAMLAYNMALTAAITITSASE